MGVEKRLSDSASRVARVGFGAGSRPILRTSAKLQSIALRGVAQ
jgi:hypothetical protein